MRNCQDQPATESAKICVRRLPLLALTFGRLKESVKANAIMCNFAAPSFFLSERRHHQAVVQPWLIAHYNIVTQSVLQLLGGGMYLFLMTVPK